MSNKYGFDTTDPITFDLSQDPKKREESENINVPKDAFQTDRDASLSTSLQPSSNTEAVPEAPEVSFREQMDARLAASLAEPAPSLIQSKEMSQATKDTIEDSIPYLEMGEQERTEAETLEYYRAMRSQVMDADVPLGDEQQKEWDSLPKEFTYIPRPPVLYSKDQILEDIEAAPIAHVRALLGAFAWMGDIPGNVIDSIWETGADLTAVENPDKYFNWEDGFQGMLNERYGTVDSYVKGPASEVASDLGDALPVVVGSSLMMARWGLNTFKTNGTVSSFAAPYVTKLEAQMGADALAVTGGEIIEEIAEASLDLEENGTGSLLFNMAGNIATPWRLQQTRLSDDVINKELKDMGGRIAPQSDATQAVTGAFNAATRPLSEGKDAVVKAFKGTRGALMNGTAWVLDNTMVSKIVFKDMANPQGSFKTMLTQQKLLNKDGSAFLKETWKNMTAEQRKTMAGRMELASEIGLDLDMYELTGMKELHSLSVAVGKIDSASTVSRMESNKEKLSAYLESKGNGLNKFAESRLKQELHNLDLSVDSMIEDLQSQSTTYRNNYLKDIGIDRGKTGDEVQDAVGVFFQTLSNKASDKYEFGAKEITISPKDFSVKLKAALKDVETNKLIDPASEVPVLIKKILGTAEGEKIGNVVKIPKATVDDLLKTRNELGKINDGLKPEHSGFTQTRDYIVAAKKAIDEQLESVLTPEQSEQLRIAKETYGTQIGARKTKNVKTSTVRNAYNKMVYDGADIIADIMGADVTAEKRAMDFTNLIKVTAETLQELEPNLVGPSLLLKAKDQVDQSMMRFVVSDVTVQLQLNPTKSVDEVIQSYIDRQGRNFARILPDFDIGKAFRSVSIMENTTNDKIAATMAQRLNLKGDTAGNFDLSTYMNKTLLGNEGEMKRLEAIMEDPEQLKNLGFTKKDMQDSFSTAFLRDNLKFDNHGMVESSDIHKLLKTHGDDLERLIGKENVEHMRSFQDGYNATTSLTPAQVQAPATNLEKKTTEASGLAWVPKLVSDRLAAAKGRVSIEHLRTLRAIQFIGGLKTDAYKKTMIKAMSDKDFFMDLVEGTSTAPTTDSIKRLRLSLAHLGIDSSIKTQTEQKEQNESFAEASRLIDMYGDVLDQEVSLGPQAQPTVEPQVQPTVEPQVQPTVEPPVQQTDDVESSSNPTLSNEETEETSNAVPIKAPSSGDIIDGYRFKGGDPNDKANWQAV